MAKLTPIKAIRAKCVECSAGSHYEVSRCEIFDCALYEYRHGKRPNTVARRELAKKSRATLGVEA